MTSVRFGKKSGFRFSFGFTKFTAVSVFWFVFCTVCCLLCMHSTECAFQFTVYFHAELVQLIVSRSDLVLEMQRYSMKKNTLTVDRIML